MVLTLQVGNRKKKAIPSSHLGWVPDWLPAKPRIWGLNIFNYSTFVFWYRVTQYLMVDHDFPIPQLSPSGAALRYRQGGEASSQNARILGCKSSLWTIHSKQLIILMITKQDLRIGSQDFSSPKRLQVFGKETFTNTWALKNVSWRNCFYHLAISGPSLLGVGWESINWDFRLRRNWVVWWFVGATIPKWPNYSGESL